ncbi:unnamed protein product, partial [Ectocarpus sp. 8 AP-2014]
RRVRPLARTAAVTLVAPALAAAAAVTITPALHAGAPDLLLSPGPITPGNKGPTIITTMTVLITVTVTIVHGGPPSPQRALAAACAALSKLAAVARVRARPPAVTATRANRRTSYDG